MPRELSRAATGIVTLILTPTGSGDDSKPDVPAFSLGKLLLDTS